MHFFLEEKFGSGWAIIIVDICFEMSLDLFWYDGISSHSINKKQNLFLTNLWSSCRSWHLNFLYYYVLCIAYVMICLLWNKFILLSHFTQIRRHSLHYHFNVMKKFYLITWNAHFYEGKKTRPSPFFRFKLLQGLNIISHVEDRKSSQQSIQSNNNNNSQNVIKTNGLLKELVGFESIVLFSAIASTAQKKKKKNTQWNSTQCLNCSSVTRSPKHSNQWLKNALWFLSVIQTSYRKQMPVTKHFCQCDNTTFPCSLVHCWLCSCFPSRSGAPDDGRPRYGLCSFSTLLSLFLLVL